MESYRSVPVKYIESHGPTSEEVIGIQYHEIINFQRVNIRGYSQHHCVMCGLDNKSTQIPEQNKDVCRACDSIFWHVKEQNVLVKFCKGCKKFVELAEFQDKHWSSKCAKCRDRGRVSYHSRKASGLYPAKKSKTSSKQPIEKNESSDNSGLSSLIIDDSLIFPNHETAWDPNKNALMNLAYITESFLIADESINSIPKPTSSKRSRNGITSDQKPRISADKMSPIIPLNFTPNGEEICSKPPLKAMKLRLDIEHQELSGFQPSMVSPSSTAHSPIVFQYNSPQEVL